MTYPWYSKAVRQPLSFIGALPFRSAMTKETVIMHTNDGGADLRPWYERPENTGHICSHGQILKDGTAIQYVPYTRVAYAQWDANPFAVSWETEDDGNPDDPWTNAQMASMQDIWSELQVPLVLAPVTGGGVGYHQQYPSWNQSGHNCPGPVRVSQLLTILRHPTATETDVIIIQVTSDPTRGPRLLDTCSGKAHGITTSDGVSAYVAAGAVIRPLSVKQYDFFVAQS